MVICCRVWIIFGGCFFFSNSILRRWRARPSMMGVTPRTRRSFGTFCLTLLVRDVYNQYVMKPRYKIGLNKRVNVQELIFEALLIMHTKHGCHLMNASGDDFQWRGHCSFSLLLQYLLGCWLQSSFYPNHYIHQQGWKFFIKYQFCYFGKFCLWCKTCWWYSKFLFLRYMISNISCVEVVRYLSIHLSLWSSSFLIINLSNYLHWVAQKNPRLQ